MYGLRRTLLGHLKGINSIQFSPDGQLLASVSCDRTALLWSLESGTLFQRIELIEHGSATDLFWVEKLKEFALFIACANGTVHIYAKALSRFEKISVFHPHSGAIERLTYDPVHQHLATVGNGELKIWSVGLEWSRITLIMAKEPSPTSGNVCRSVHFFDGGKGVLACYLESHQVWAWDMQSLEPLWQRQVFTRMSVGYSSISNDGKTLLVDNLDTGADTYAVPSMRRLQGYQSQMKIALPKQAVFGAADTEVIQGDDDGKVHVFDLISGKRLQILQHTASNSVQVVTSHLHADSHWIASASTNQGECIIKVWTKPVKATSTSHFRFPWIPLLRVLELCAVIFLILGLAIFYFDKWHKKPRDSGREMQMSSPMPIFKMIVD